MAFASASSATACGSRRRSLERMDAAEEETAARAKLDLVIAVAYGGRWDIAQAGATTCARGEAEGRLRRCRDR